MSWNIHVIDVMFRLVKNIQEKVLCDFRIECYENNLNYRFDIAGATFITTNSNDMLQRLARAHTEYCPDES